MMRVIVVSLFAIIGMPHIKAATLPADVQPCAVNLPLNEYNACILRQVKIITPHLAKGAKTLNLPALDPFRIPALFIDRTLDSLKIKANMRNVQVYGGSNYVIEDLRASPKDLSVTLKVLFPRLEVAGDYDVQGRLLLLPLVGVGSFKGNFTEIETDIEASGKEVTDKKGVKRIDINDLLVKVRIGGGKLKLRSSTQTQALAADAVTTFFNSNPRLVLDIASPIVDDTAAAVAKGLVARALATLSKEEILP